VNSAGTTNMPSGEVFTTPVEDSVNGSIRFSYPGIFMGQEIEDIRLVVKKGEIVGWQAKKGKELLDKVLEIPGAKRFGEAAYLSIALKRASSKKFVGLNRLG